MESKTIKYNGFVFQIFLPKTYVNVIDSRMFAVLVSNIKNKKKPEILFFKKLFIVENVGEI